MNLNNINIVCLKWGTKYGPEYVNNLYGAIKRNTTVSFKFHCFTENSKNLNNEIISHKLPYSTLEGWWNKLYLFSDELPIPVGEKIFFIDLDTLITKNIDDILTYDCQKIVVLRDFYTGHVSSIVGDDNVGSGLMSWYHGQYGNVWDTFIKDPNGAIKSLHPHGDQKWVQKHALEREYWQDIFPDQVVSFKVHCGSGLPEKASIICYHGIPSIPDSATKHTKVWKHDFMPQPWVLEHWRS